VKLLFRRLSALLFTTFVNVPVRQLRTPSCFDNLVDSQKSDHVIVFGDWFKGHPLGSYALHTQVFTNDLPSVTGALVEYLQQKYGISPAIQFALKYHERLIRDIDDRVRSVNTARTQPLLTGLFNTELDVSLEEKFYSF